MHRYQTSQIPLRDTTEHQNEPIKSNKLKYFYHHYLPKPPLSESLRQLVQNDLDKAISSMTEAMMIKQEHDHLFYAHLLLFVYYDQHIDEILREAVRDEKTRKNEDFLGHQPRNCQPTILHKAVLSLSQIEREEENPHIRHFLNSYKTFGDRTLERDESPSITNGQYFKLRQKILHKALEAVVDILDLPYIDFILAQEVDNLHLSYRVCSTFFEEKFFDRLWRYSRLQKLLPLEVRIDQKALARFYVLERDSANDFMADAHIKRGNQTVAQRFHEYYQKLYESRIYCKYLAPRYAVDDLDDQNDDLPSYLRNSLKQIGNKHNLKRSIGYSSQIKEVNSLLHNLSAYERQQQPKLKSQKANDTLVSAQEETQEVKQDDFESGMTEVQRQEKSRQTQTEYFEFSLLAKFLKFLLVHNNNMESEIRAEQCKIVQLLRYVRVKQGIEDESALRMLLRLGYENQVFYLIVAENYCVSPQLLVTAIECEAFMLALMLEGGCKYTQISNEKHKCVLMHPKRKEPYVAYEYEHPVYGYHISLKRMYEEFNHVQLNKLRNRPEYLQIILFLWKRHISLISFRTAQNILSEIEAQIEFAVTDHNADGGYLRFLNNPLKLIILQIEFVNKINNLHPQFYSKVVKITTLLEGVALKLEAQIRDSSNIMADAMRFILEDEDIEGRKLINLIAANDQLIQLLDHPVIERSSVEKWEGPYHTDKSLVPPQSINRELLARFFSERLGQERPVPLKFVCFRFKRCCCSRRVKSRGFVITEEEEEDQLSQPLAPNCLERLFRCKYKSPEFEFGYIYKSKNFSQKNRSLESVPLYQYEVWRDGQELRYYESYVYEFFIFFLLHYYLFRIIDEYKALGSVLPTAMTSQSDIAAYAHNLQSLNSTFLDVIWMSCMFLFLPMHYTLLYCYYRKTRTNAKQIVTAASFLDLFLFILQLIATFSIFPPYIAFSVTGIQTYDPQDPSLTGATLLDYKTRMDASHVWTFIVVLTGITWLQMAIAMRVSKAIGPLYKVLRLNCKDFFKWIVMIIITLSTFSVAGFSLALYDLRHPCLTFKDCFIMFFEASLGQISFDEQVGIVSGEVLLIFCILTNLILLVTILIAMLTETYEKIDSQAKLYYMKDIFEIVSARKIDKRFGAFISLDFPFTIFPGTLILLLLHCLQRSAINERNLREKEKKLRRLEKCNAAYVRFPAYFLAWIIVSGGSLLFNMLSTPLIWVLILYNELKILFRPETLIHAQPFSNQLRGREHLAPYHMKHSDRQDRLTYTRKRCCAQGTRLNRFFSFTLWTLILGFPMVVIQTLIEVCVFCVNFMRSQESLLRDQEGKDVEKVKNYDRHELSYDLQLDPQTLSSLATLAFEELKSCQKKAASKAKPQLIKDLIFQGKRRNPYEEQSVQDDDNRSVISSTTFDSLRVPSPRQRIALLSEAHHRWRESKCPLDFSPNAINFIEFYRALLKEIDGLEARHLHSNSTFFKDSLFKAGVLSKREELQKAKEMFKRLLLHFSVKRSQILDLNENIQTQQFLPNGQAVEEGEQDQELEKMDQLKNKIQMKHLSYLYLDCFVGIYSNLLIYGKLETFTLNPSRIPPSARLEKPNAPSVPESHDHPKENFKNNKSAFHPDNRQLTKHNKYFQDRGKNLKTQKSLQRLPTSLRLEEGSFIKVKQIKMLFFIYNLQRLIQALRSFNSSSFRDKNSLGELQRCAKDLRNLSYNNRILDYQIQRKIELKRQKKKAQEMTLEQNIHRTLTEASDTPRTYDTSDNEGTSAKHHPPLVSEVDILSEDIASARVRDPRKEDDFDNLDVHSYVAQTERMSPKLVKAKENLDRSRSEKQEAWKKDRAELNEMLTEFEEELSHSPLK